MEDKKQLTIVMGTTIEYANKESVAKNPIAVAFVNWVNKFELDTKEGYIILNE